MEFIARAYDGHQMKYKQIDDFTYTALQERFGLQFSINIERRNIVFQLLWRRLLSIIAPVREAFVDPES